MKTIFALCILICGYSANAADLTIPVPNQFVQTYLVKDAAEAQTRMQQSKVLAELKLKSDVTLDRSDFIPSGEFILVTYKWKRSSDVK